MMTMAFSGSALTSLRRPSISGSLSMAVVTAAAAHQLQHPPAPNHSNQHCSGGGDEGAKPPGAPPRRLDFKSEHGRLFPPLAPNITRFHLQPVIVGRQSGKLHLV